MTVSQKKLDTVFRCTICKHDESAECRIDPKRKAAEASCWACGCEASYSAAAEALTEPIDESQRAIKGGGVRGDYDGDAMMAGA